MRWLVAVAVLMLVQHVPMEGLRNILENVREAALTGVISNFLRFGTISISGSFLSTDLKKKKKKKKRL